MPWLRFTIFSSHFFVLFGLLARTTDSSSIYVQIGCRWWYCMSSMLSLFIAHVLQCFRQNATNNNANEKQRNFADTPLSQLNSTILGQSFRKLKLLKEGLTRTTTTTTAQMKTYGFVLLVLSYFLRFFHQIKNVKKNTHTQKV